MAAVVATAALALYVLVTQAYSAFTWAQTYKEAHIFGDQCGYAIGLWGPGDTWEAVAKRQHAFTKLDMPYKRAAIGEAPIVPKSAYLLTRCVTDTRDLKPEGFAWLQLGRIFGDNAVFVNGTLRLVQSDNGIAELPVTPGDRGKEFELLLVSRPNDESPWPGIAASAPPLLTDDRGVLARINRVTTLYFIEMPLFRMGYFLSLILIFAVAWMLGIRYPDVAWILLAGTILAWQEFLNFHPYFNSTRIESQIENVLRFAGILAFAGFFFSFLRFRLPGRRLELGFLACVVFYAVLIFTLPNNWIRALELRYITPSAIQTLLLTGIGIRGWRLARTLVGKRRSQVRIAVVTAFIAAALTLIQGLIERTTEIEFAPFLALAIMTTFSIFLGADLVVFHRQYFQERAHRVEEGQKMALMQERLRLGRSVQDLLLPKKLEGAFGSVKYRFFYEPAGEMSGDWLSIWQKGDGELRLLMGDVVGKGPYAALAVSVVIGAISECRTADVSMEETIQRINGRLVDLFDLHITSTLTALTAHADNSMVDLYNCGGNGFIVIGRETSYLTLRSTPLGCAPTVVPAHQQIMLRPNEMVCSFSDGCLSGGRALKSLVHELRKLDAPSLSATDLHKLILRLGRESVFEDDRSMLVVKGVRPAQDAVLPTSA